LALNLDFQATKKLRLDAGFTYSKADDEMEWSFTERSLVIAKGGGGGPLANHAGSPGGMYAAQNYDNWELNNKIDGYSDLSYDQYQFTAGGTYNFTEQFYTNATFSYDIFDMGEEYVYGDEDGTAYYGYVGVGWTF